MTSVTTRQKEAALRRAVPYRLLQTSTHGKMAATQLANKLRQAASNAPLLIGARGLNS